MRLNLYKIKGFSNVVGTVYVTRDKGDGVETQVHVDVYLSLTRVFIEGWRPRT